MTSSPVHLLTSALAMCILQIGIQPLKISVPIIFVEVGCRYWLSGGVKRKWWPYYLEEGEGCLGEENNVGFILC